MIYHIRFKSLYVIHIKYSFLNIIIFLIYDQLKYNIKI